MAPAYLALRTGGFDRVLVSGGFVIFLACTLLSIRTWASVMAAPVFDWQFYSAATARWLAGEPIYPGGVISTLGTAAGAGYAYPPASVPLFLPFAPWPLGAVLWITLIASALLAGIWVVVRAGWPDRPMPAYAAAMAGLAVFPPIQQGLGVGNVNILTAGLLGFAWAVGRPVAPAVGILTVLKVFPLSLAAPLGVRTVITSAAAAALLALLTLPLVGVASWVDYASALRQAEMLCGDPRWFNPSLACLLQPAIGSDLARWSGLLVAGLLVLVALRAGRTVIGMSAAGLAVIAPATEVHAHYLGLLYVLAWIALATWARRGRDA